MSAEHADPREIREEVEHTAYGVMMGYHTRFASYPGVLNEILHPRRGFKGFPGRRTVGEQRDLVLGLLRNVFALEEEVYRLTRENAGFATANAEQESPAGVSR